MKRIIVFCAIGFCSFNTFAANNNGENGNLLKKMIKTVEIAGNVLIKGVGNVAKFIDKATDPLKDLEEENTEQIVILEKKAAAGQLSEIDKAELIDRKSKKIDFQLERAKMQNEVRKMALKVGGTIAEGKTLAKENAIKARESAYGAELVRQENAEKNLELKIKAEDNKYKNIQNLLKGSFNLLSQHKKVIISLVGGSFALYYLFNFLSYYAKRRLDKIPNIVRETSRKPLWKKFFSNNEPTSYVSNVIAGPKIRRKLDEIAEEITFATSLDEELYNVLFYGPPGVGKTMFAKELAKNSGIDYAIISGADFSQLKLEEAIAKLHELLDWAEKSPTILFIDECEAFLRNRALGGSSEASKKLTQAFLSRVDKPYAKNLMIVLATNCPEDIDPAAMSRIRKKIEFTMPDKPEVEKLINLYIDKHTKNGTSKPGEDFDKREDNFANLMTKYRFSGREIDDVIKNICYRSRIENQGTISANIAQRIINEKIEETKAIQVSQNTSILAQKIPPKLARAPRGG